MVSNCPGQDSRKLRVSMHKCPNCSNEVEIFSDELRIKCRKCGEIVHREKVPSCIDLVRFSPSMSGRGKVAGTKQGDRGIRVATRAECPDLLSDQ